VRRFDVHLTFKAQLTGFALKELALLNVNVVTKRGAAARRFV